MSKFLECSLLNVLNVASIILSLFVARSLGAAFELPYAMHYTCAAWGIYALVRTWDDAEKFLAFNHSRPPSEMIAHGCAGLIYIALVTWQPFNYPQLADMPWPFRGSLYAFVIPGTPGHVYFVEWLSVIGLVLVPLFYALGQAVTGVVTLSLMAFGKLDPEQFTRVPHDDKPSYYELTQTIRALEKALSTAEGASDAAEAQTAQLRRERDVQTREEQAIRQELVRSATQLSVLQKENAQLFSDLKAEQDAAKDLRASLLDLETVVQDLRTRLHAQGAKQPKPSTNRPKENAAGALAEIIDPKPS